MNVAVLIVAAGRGERASSPGGPAKQYAMIGSKSVLARSVEAFAGHGSVTSVQVVIHPEDAELYWRAIAGTCDESRLLPPVTGGASRQQSVYRGLEALKMHSPDIVLIHDAARPFVDAATISRVIESAARTSGAIAAVALVDTLKKADGTHLISATIDRDGLWRAQTPQGFAFKTILAAHHDAQAQNRDGFTDDAALAEWANLKVAVVQGSEANTKITTREDLLMAELRVVPAAMFETRTGTGFDVHRFAPGDHVWLCGVKIPHPQKLDGHSDADVGLHALTDALLGAIGDGDIGHHFPPSDAKWKGAASHLFLADAARRISERGGKVINVDVTLLCEAPRIGPYREAMQRAIADILAIETSRVGIKATTTEGLGFTGRREGIAAMASANVRMAAPPTI